MFSEWCKEMNSQLYCHVHFTQMFIPSQLLWVVNRSALLGRCSWGVLLIKMSCVAAGLCHSQEQVWCCTGFAFGCGVWGSACDCAPRFQDSELTQTSSGTRWRSLRCCCGLGHETTQVSYGSSVSASLDPSSSRPCPMGKKRKRKIHATIWLPVTASQMNLVTVTTPLGSERSCYHSDCKNSRLIFSKLKIILSDLPVWTFLVAYIMGNLLTLHLSELINHFYFAFL